MSEPPATVSDLLRYGRCLLDATGVDTSDLDAEVLLRHVLMLDRSSFLARFPESITGNQYAHYEELLQARASGVPVAYLPA
jgi:release factor glutamine methyltransferase